LRGWKKEIPQTPPAEKTVAPDEVFAGHLIADALTKNTLDTPAEHR